MICDTLKAMAKKKKGDVEAVAVEPKTWVGVSLGLIAAVFATLFFWYYPYIGHDNSMAIGFLHEMSDAWTRFNVLDPEFSPFRCLGLPVFSHPNSLVWSAYHAAAYVFSWEALGVYAVMTAFGIAGWWGTYLFLRRLGFGAGLGSVLATGWVLQGFCVSHSLAGHTNYVQLSLLPWFMYLGLRREQFAWSVLAMAFWMAHGMFSSAHYVWIIGLPSTFLATAIFRKFAPEAWRRAEFGTELDLLKRMAVSGGIAIAVVLPKVLGSFNFAALFPREIALERVGFGGSLVYVLSNFVFPFPYDVKGITGWWYGNWESYEFFYPGLLFWWGYTLWQRRAELPWARILKIFGALVVVGTLFSSGWLSTIYSQIPVLKSMHVNPRWNAFILTPMWALVAATLLLLGRTEAPRRTLIALMACVVITPLLFIDRENMATQYPDRGGISYEKHRLMYCYEPIFGYGLENFPYGSKVNWLADQYIDPRCYLKSNDCKPGTLFGSTPTSTKEDEAAFLRYEMKDMYPPVRNFKPWSLLLYLACALAALVVTFRIQRRD